MKKILGVLFYILAIFFSLSVFGNTLKASRYLISRSEMDVQFYELIGALVLAIVLVIFFLKLGRKFMKSKKENDHTDMTIDEGI